MSEVRKTCTIEGCEKSHVARGLCSTHYAAAKYRGEFVTKARDGSQGCAVDECERDHYARGYCNSHYGHLLRHGTPTPVKEETFCHCGKTAVSRGMCKSHYMRDYYQRNPDKLERLRELSRAYVRPDNLPLKPVKEVVTYWQAHKRVSAQRGKPTTHTCSCGAQAKQWALIHGRGTHEQTIRGYDLPYSLDVDDYQPMCVPCHKRYDLGREDA